MTSITQNSADIPQDDTTNMRRAWLVVFVMVFFIALACVDRFLITLAIDPIKKTFGLDDAAMGLLQGPAFAIFFLIGSLPMGWLVDRFSKRLLLYLGISIWSVATVGFGLVESLIGLLAARAILGLGQAVLQPAAWSMISKLFPPQKMSLALSVFATGAQLGVAGSYLLGGFVIS